MIAGVTGASGFIGQDFVDTLLRRGWSVRSLARKPVPRTPFNAKLETRVIGPLETVADLSAHLKDCHTVYHLAGKAHAKASEADDDAAFEAANCAATARLAEAAVAAGCRRFVFVSSVKVHGDTTDDREPFQPTDRLSPQDAYARSKLRAEQALADIAAESALRVVIVRPPLVVGPDPRGNLDRLARLIESGLPLPLGAVNNRRSVIGLENLCDLLVHLGTAKAIPDIPLLVHDLTLSTPDLIRQLAARRGRQVRLPALPKPLLRLAFRLLGRRTDMNRLLGSMEIDRNALPPGLGWRPDPARNPLSLDRHKRLS